MELAQEWFSYVTRKCAAAPISGRLRFSSSSFLVVIGAHVDGRQRKEE
jgi:hypothetical protein